MAFQPNRVSRPREQIEIQLREAILRGEIAQGERLPSETVLAKEFGVSRTTIREALRALVSAGLIVKTPGTAGGSFVQAVDHRSLGSALGTSLTNTVRIGSITVNEVHALRRMLEVPAAFLAAKNRTDADLEAIKGVLERERTAGVEDPEIVDMDINFHSTVADASANRPLAAFVSALHHAARPVEQLPLSPKVGRDTVSQHKAVVAAIEAGDAEAAASAMTVHLDYIADITGVDSGSDSDF